MTKDLILTFVTYLYIHVCLCMVEFVHQYIIIMFM